MKPSLQLKISQHLALTPQLQQSIRLLQLSTLELNREIEQALADNPLLERLDDPLSHAAAISASGGLDTRGGTEFGLSSGTSSGGDHRDAPSDGAATDGGHLAAGASEGASGDEAGSFSDTAWDGAGGDGADWGFDGSSGARSASDGGDDEREYPEVAASGGTLREHLQAQAVSTHGTVRDRALLELLIDELNESGLLETSVEEICEAMPPELHIEPEEVRAALNLLQSFDPPGVAARDLRECLSIQLDRGAGAGLPLRVRHAASVIVSDYLETLAARDFARLKRNVRCDDETLRQAQALIRTLNPRPASGFAGESPTYLVPDVIVKKVRNTWTATLNPDVLPKLRINEMYARILRRNRGGNASLSGQLQEARWLVKNVQQRFETILRVSQAIVERQKSFFSHGEVAMRPLVLREIAETLGLHESTISRVTTQKYMLTPMGTFELKYFFGSHVATDSGGAASSTAVRALIRQFIDAEEPRAPLSDNRVAELLAEQGFVVARRTVAKYRESLQIPAVAQRRAL